MLIFSSTFYRGWPMDPLKMPDPTKAPPRAPSPSSFFNRFFHRGAQTAPERDPSRWWSEKLPCAFEVDDRGLGIPPEKRELVFENFVQADSSTTRLHGGTGLGLGIVRSLGESLNDPIAALIVS